MSGEIEEEKGEAVRGRFHQQVQGEETVGKTRFLMTESGRELGSKRLEI